MKTVEKPLLACGLWISVSKTRLVLWFIGSYILTVAPAVSCLVIGQNGTWLSRLAMAGIFLYPLTMLSFLVGLSEYATFHRSRENFIATVKSEGRPVKRETTWPIG